MFIYSYSKTYAKARFCQNCHKGMTKMAYGMTIMSPISVFVTSIFIKEINKRPLYFVLHLIIFTFANSKKYRLYTDDYSFERIGSVW